MIIDQNTNIKSLNDGYLYQEPDFFVEDSKMKSPSYVKWVMDYFANIAFQQYQVNKRTFAKNYDLMKGILSVEDFYEETPETKSMIDTLIGKEALPSYVKNYSILTSPINTLVGELSKIPDTQRVRAYDDFSKNEELDYYTNILQEYVINESYKKILTKLQMSGADLADVNPEDLQQQAYKDISDQLEDYSSEAEIWGNATLEALKVELDLKDKFEDAYRDLLIANKWATHTYEDGSRRGFNVEVVNPKNLVRKKSPDQKYLDKCYIQGIIRSMEISEIIERFPNLSKKEIDHLRKENRTDEPLGRSNLFSSQTGSTTIKYDTYSKLQEEEKLFLEAELSADENFDDVGSLLGLESNSSINNRFTVLEMYWQGKKKVGKLIYLDQDENEQAILVDENYKEGSPNEVSIEWGWINQKYKGYKIGSYVYNIEPYTFTDSMPIVGVEHEIKNTSSVSLVGMAIPFQVLYNVCMNQLFSLIKNEKGRVMPIGLKAIPRLKDGDDQDAIDMWEEEAKRSGFIFIDDSPENRNTQMQYQSIDLTKTQEIQTRYNLAVQLKRECMELIGFTDARLGSVAATSTAQGIQTSLTQSFAQTAPLVAQHEVVVNKTYQVILEAAQTIESTKEDSTLSYLNNQGMTAFVRVNANQLSLRDLHVLSVNSSKDSELMMKLQGLAQEMIQNGTDVHTISELYTSNSVRQWQKATKTLKEHAEALQNQAQQQQQAQLESQNQIAQAQLQQQAQLAQIQMENDNMNKAADRQVKIDVALATAASFNNGPQEDLDNNGIPDALQAAKFNQQSQQLQSQQNLLTQQLTLKREEIAAKTELGKQKLSVDLQNQANDLQISLNNKANRKSK